jgi:cytidine deaminase
MIARDESEEQQDTQARYGQNVRKAFPMADVILRSEEPHLNDDVNRFVRLLFGENEVPRHDEHAMYMADGTAALSSSLSRKVGACLTTPRGEIIAVGTNEVPKAGGGQYGAGDFVGQDKERGVDHSTVSLQSIAAETVVTLAAKGWLTEQLTERAKADPDALAVEAIEVFREAKLPIMDLIEFQRPVHAEVAALLDAGRRGVPTQGATLYTTTYPMPGRSAVSGRGPGSSPWSR